MSVDPNLKKYLAYVKSHAANPGADTIMFDEKWEKFVERRDELLPGLTTRNAEGRLELTAAGEAALEAT